MNLFLLLIPILTFGQSISFKTYMNPVIPGDHADCTVSKVGNDFYTTGSSFNPTPVIYHSTDLVHWEAIAQPVSAAWSGYGDTPGGGCWGGHIVYRNGEYWDFFSRANTMYFVKASKPEGPWSNPVMVKNPSTLSYSLGYDNSIFIDDDNKWYLVVKNGQPNNGIVELDDNGQPTGVVYNLDWLNPSPYRYSWAEGPVMWKHNGYYYYAFAKDLSGGQYVMRSDTLTADESAWEIMGNFFNENDPQKSSSLFTSPNHVSPVVTLEDSTYWVIHPLYAKGEWKGQGRQGLLNQVHYDANDKPTADYPINSTFTAPDLPSSGIPWMVPHTDFFNSDTLNPEWSFLGSTPNIKWSLSERTGWIRITPKNRTKANTIIKNDGEHNYSIITRLDFDPASTSDEAGLWIMRGDEKMFVKLVSTFSSDSGKTIKFSFNTTQYEIKNTVGDTLWFKLVRVNHKISGYYSNDGFDWNQIGSQLDISEIDSYSDFSTFTGTRQGLYVNGSNDCWFDLYIYRDAYTPILAECPANQFGNKRGVQQDGTTILNNIINDNWAMYAGVEFGNNEYQKNCDSLNIIASSANAGGNVEVYIDSIDENTKIADCEIKSTGSWTSFQTFSAKLLTTVSGNHDVYLKFSGTGSDKLFQLKSFQFTTNSTPTSINESQGNLLPGKFYLYQNYPNPFNPVTTIKYTIPYLKAKGDATLQLKVYDILGRDIATLVNKKQQPGTYEVTFDGSKLTSGVYLYTIKSDNYADTKKLVLLK